MSFYCSVNTSPQNQQASTHCSPQRLSPSFESKRNQWMKCISNIGMFFRDYFQQCTYLFIFPLSKGILMGESTNKYVRFDVFILSFFFLSFFHCSALSVKQLACLLFLTRSFDISHNLTKAT